MKRVKQVIIAVLMLLSLSVRAVYASTPTWEELPGHHSQSILLKNGEKSSEDVIDSIARGTIMSTAAVGITDQEDGTLYITAHIFVHKNIDKAYQTIFLDQWDESSSKWIQVGKWDFERSKEEEEDGELSMYRVAFIVSGCEVNYYYRARGMHYVQIGDDMEGKATRTNGVLLTKK